MLVGESAHPSDTVETASPSSGATRRVYVVDDDRDVRRSISFMLGAEGMVSHPFASGCDFLAGIDDLEPGCVLLDIRMPDTDGFQVMQALAARGSDWPVVVMTGHGEVAVAVRAMKLGAVDFLEKPFPEDALLSALSAAFRLLGERVVAGARTADARSRVAALTTREREVLRNLLAGRSNKVIAQRLGLSLRTVEMHRGNMMDRLRATSLAEALTLAMLAGVEPAQDAAA